MRRSRQLRSPRRRQDLRTWARLTGGRLVVSLNPLEIEGARWPASLGPATVADAQAFTTWLATRRRWGLVPDAVPLREQPSETLGPFPTPGRPDPWIWYLAEQWGPVHEQPNYAKALAPERTEQ